VPAEDAADDALVLLGEKAARLVRDRLEVLGDREEIQRLALRRADAVEQLADGDAVLLARRALAARLHREEPRHALRQRGEVGAVVVDEERAASEPAPDRGHVLVG